MSETQDDLARRLREARTAAGYESPTDAARAMGTNVVTYLGHENSSRGYRASASRYADFFGVNLEWLLTERGPMKRADAAQSAPYKSTEDLTTPSLNIQQWSRDVPILGGASCGEDGLFEMNGQILGHAKRPPALIGAKDVYALYIYGESMVPWREHSGLVYVDPHRPVKINDYVVVQLLPIDPDALPAAYIKRLLRRSPEKLVLQQYNPREEKIISAKKVKSVHRIVDWDELMAL